jgi:hypothetical protein
MQGSFTSEEILQLKERHYVDACERASHHSTVNKIEIGLERPILLQVVDLELPN